MLASLFMHYDHLGNSLPEFRFNNHCDLHTAYNLGYRASPDGKIYGVRFKRSLEVNFSSRKYPCFKIRIDKRNIKLKAHQFVAYTKFGFKMFEPGMVVRHLDDDKSNYRFTNIAIGTQSQNQMDKPVEERSRIARTARAAQGKSSPRAKLTPSQVQYIRDFYLALTGERAGNGKVQKICDELGVTRVTLRNVARGRVYRYMN